MERIFHSIIGAGVAFLLATAESPAQSFNGLGYLDGGNPYTIATGISGDGQTVIGYGQMPIEGGPFEAYYNQAFYWTRTAGVVSLGDLPGSNPQSLPSGISHDGRVIVGMAEQAFIWTPDQGMVPLEGTVSGTSVGFEARAISGDGNTVVGQGVGATGTTEAFMWTREGGFVGLGELPGGYTSSSAEAVSHDGRVIVGVSQSALGQEAMRWTHQNGMEGLGDLEGGGVIAYAWGVSGDGSTVIGWGTTATSASEAFSWTEQTGMIDLWRGAANAVSYDGQVVVGRGDVDGPMLWTATDGARNLQDVLVNDYGLAASLDGWTLMDAVGVSADGNTLAGWGENPNGDIEAWIAVIPEPTTFTLLGLGCLAMMVVRQRR